MRAAPLVRTENNPLGDAAEAVWLDADDGARLRRVHFGGTGERGTALIVPGWAEPSEKYAEVAGDLIDRGFDVFTYDPRGQGLSERISDESDRARLTDYAKHLEDLGAIIRSLPSARLTVIGHSMGGLSVLSWLADGGEADAAILSAPATRIYPHALQRWAVRGVARVLMALGMPDVPLTKEGGMAMRFEGNTLTSDPVRHDVLRQLLLADDRLRLPRASPAMVAAMHRQQAKIHEPGALDGLSVPVLMVSAIGDEWVDSTDHPQIAERSPMIDLVSIEGSRHEILMERDEVRQRFWAAFDVHIERHMPAASAAST